MEPWSGSPLCYENETKSNENDFQCCCGTSVISDMDRWISLHPVLLCYEIFTMIWYSDNLLRVVSSQSEFHQFIILKKHVCFAHHPRTSYSIFNVAHWAVIMLSSRATRKYMWKSSGFKKFITTHQLFHSFLTECSWGYGNIILPKH